MMTILPTITTKPPASWQDKMEEVKKLELEEIYLFLTCLNKTERQKLYALLKETKVKSIPFVHLRNDMMLDELDYFVKNYQTKVFNTHSRREFPHLYDYASYRKAIYIENIYQPLDEEEIKEFAGVCIDFSHLENDRLLRPEKYQKDIEVIEKYGSGCGHIGAIKKQVSKDEEGFLRHDSHFLDALSELDYLKKYPPKYFGQFIAIELQNSIEDQLKVIDYLDHLWRFQ